jgi:hypothetical protein
VRGGAAPTPQRGHGRQPRVNPHEAGGSGHLPAVRRPWRRRPDAEFRAIDLQQREEVGGRVVVESGGRRVEAGVGGGLHATYSRLEGGCYGVVRGEGVRRGQARMGAVLLPAMPRVLPVSST